jgi:hypothetical protein
MSVGGNQAAPQDRHFGTTKRFSRAAAQNGSLSEVGTGAGNVAPSLTLATPG